jgi:hypothetical protein
MVFGGVSHMQHHHHQRAHEHLRLFDDERFTLGEDVKRRLVYRPLGQFPANDYGDNGPVKLIEINITENLCSVVGARRLEDLKEETHDLINLLFNALSFALGKKKRLSTQSLPGGNSGQKRGSGRQQQQHQQPIALNASNAGLQHQQQQEGDEGNQPRDEILVDETDRLKHYFNGEQSLTVVVETLVTKDSLGIKVVGFRWLVFDASTDGSGQDLLTRALQECLLECSMMQEAAEKERTEKEKGHGRKAKNGPPPPKEYEVKPIYRFMRINSYPLFLRLAAAYFQADDLLWQQQSEVVQEEWETPVSHFVDRRAFLQHNGGDAGIAASPENYLSTIFSPEQSMVYHAESCKVVKEQRCLASYFARNQAEIRRALEEQDRLADDPERYVLLLNSGYKETDFKSFPFPAITYRVDPNYVSNEVLNDVPFPHAIGSYLYTTKDRASVARRIAVRAQHQQHQQVLFGLAANEREEMLVEAREEWDLPADSLVAPLGLHDLEPEITAELFHTYRQYVSDDMQRYLASGGDAQPSPNAKAGFLNRVENDVKMDLMCTARALTGLRSYLRGVREDGRRPVLVTACLPAQSSLTEEKDIGELSPSGQPLLNHNKELLLDRRVFAEIGRDEMAREKERRKMFTSANIAYYRPYIGKWRPIAATVENVVKFVRNVRYDLTYLERDIYWVLDSLNEEGFAALDRAYFDPETGKVRAGQLKEYLYEKRLFIEGITVEMFHEFLYNPRVSLANRGIRDDLTKGTSADGLPKTSIGIQLPIFRFQQAIRPFHAYMLHLYSYFTEVGGICMQFKTMNMVWHAKYHCFRTYAPGVCDPKLNVAQIGSNSVGKSKRLEEIRRSCPTDVCLKIDHWTPQAFNTMDNFSDMLVLNDEMSHKLVGANASNKHGAGYSDAGQDDARNHAKARMTGHETQTMTIFIDENGNRRRVICKQMNQYVTLGNSNVSRSDIDPNYLSRLIAVDCSRASAMVEPLGQRPQDKNRIDMGMDDQINEQFVEEQKEVFRVYFLAEMMGKAGIMQSRQFGASTNAAQIYIGKILNLMQAKYGITTNNVRKRKFVLEMARSLCLAFACWYALYSPLLRYLQRDPYTKEFIGINPRFLLDGVAKNMVVTKEQVGMSLTMLSCLWGHEHEDRVLETFAIKKCHLNKPEKATFLPVQNSTAVNYNYVRMTEKSWAEIHSLLSVAMPTSISVSVSEVESILRDLSKGYIQCEGYKLQDGKLVNSGKPDENVTRKIVDYSRDPTNPNKWSIAISVAFLKQKLAHLLPDGLIEDLSSKIYTREDSDCSELVDDDEEHRRDRDAPLTDGELETWLQQLMVVKKNAPNDTYITKAMREVMEHEIFEWTGETTPEQEAEDFADYVDPVTGKIPWFTLVTADHLPPIQLRDVMPHETLKAYNKTIGHTREIPLTDMLAVLQLERPKKCSPFVTYNFTTAPPSAKCSMNAYNGADIAGNDADNYEEMEEDVVDELLDGEIYTRKDLTAEGRERRKAERVKRIAEAVKLRRLNVCKNRYKMYADTPVFHSTVDLDFDECRHHMLQMAYPRQRLPNGRLENYPPHMYMSLWDFNDTRERKTGEKTPVVPLHANLHDKIGMTRRIIDAAVNKTERKDWVTHSQLCDANYEEVDLRQMIVPPLRRGRRNPVQTQRANVAPEEQVREKGKRSRLVEDLFGEEEESRTKKSRSSAAIAVK